MRRRGVVALAAVLVPALVGLVPSSASEARTYHLSVASPTAQWKGVIRDPAPLGCESPGLGCDSRTLVVTAARGSAITIGLDSRDDELQVLYDGYPVASAGTDLNPLVTTSTTPVRSTVAFEQVRDGAVSYSVVVGNAAATRLSPASYTVTARLGVGQGQDSNLACTIANLDGTQDTGVATTRTLRVRLVGAPGDAAAIRQVGRTLPEIYARIGVPVRVTYDFFPLHVRGIEYPWEAVRRHYGGHRPAATDVVDVVTDEFAGGVAACIGGVRSPDQAFANSQLHYKTEGLVALRNVPPALLAAHEIGHLLGAQHNQSNCAEAASQQVAAPASDGSFGPCTLMGPLAYQDSETFSTLERNTVRAYVDTFADR